MIRLENIEVTFGKGTPLENPVLRRLSLAVATGESIALIGGNGAGKSTLMNVIAGEVPVDSGDIYINSKAVTGVGVEKRSRWVSRVFQDPLAGTCADLTIEENLALADSRGQLRLFRPYSTKVRRDLFRERLADLNLGLEDRLNDSMGFLSGGQRQAVSLVMATLQPSKILLLDEPTAALDPKMARTLIDLTDKLIKKYELITLMITHSMQQALTFGSRTIVLKEGVVEADIKGQERESMQSSDLVAFFE